MSNGQRSASSEEMPFGLSVVEGVTGGHDGLPGQRVSAPPAPSPARRRLLTVDEYVAGVRSGDRSILARAITLIESNAPAHIELAQEVLRALLPYTGGSLRVGITGVPGVGKSTFIEALGTMLCERGHHVAVLAVDPSSSISRGSILGDKTRMERLSRHPNAYIRPSPTGGSLGGVARKTRETLLLCEAAGFDIVLVETVGVGQSEVAVRGMVDFFLLLMLAGAGDELQGIKKGIIELADALLITKADGDNRTRALAAQAEYTRALRYLAPATEGWRPRAYICSAQTGEGIAEIWREIERFRDETTASGVFAARRRNQARDWVYTLIEDHLRTRFFGHPVVQEKLPAIEQAVVEGTLPVTTAVQTLIQAFEGALQGERKSS
ncbi:MAG: methylmalonyl Co-A mutase-associated GTPase MeaB [Roseiflexus sp.]|nr:methylmalonyl Co-A mutase-associated GTPase MeaB [Roseiflexus sp.]MCS7289837.1 methylmalonyl Co-A mutase-associated GTPase MeaB [Roseiflexus sp.]MDW8146926.1 methylmalonyl Co-A mutase-associated GTPase MeaB [Roseiflexaceae bacterium]MDW8232565.1 methylmalonyl Co-A mutase-associated GTPase MeaB [Roseiflexaceae bacterium]